MSETQVNPALIVAENYEKNVVTYTTGPFAAMLLEHANPQPGEQVLDVACGTGVVARLAAPLVGESGRVVGVDVNPHMIAVAGSLPTQDGAAVEWREGNALALPLPDESFDLVLCQAGLQFIPDRPGALQEMYRVLKPGGRVALSVWSSIERNPVQYMIWGTIAGHLDTPLATLNPAFTLGDTGEVRALLGGTGFSDVMVTDRSYTIRQPRNPNLITQIFSSLSGILPKLAAMDEEQRAALAQAVEGEISLARQKYIEEEEELYPTTAHIVLARKPENSIAKPGMDTIQSLSRAVHPAFAMLAGCQLGVFTALKEGSLTADQVASALQADATRLRPLLYALVSAGLLTVEQGCFSNSEEADVYLVKGSPNYMGPVYDVWAMIWAAEMRSAESIRTGVAQCRHLFDYANKSPEALEKIFRGLHGPSMANGRILAQRFDFSACKTVLDVGGGSGGLVIALLQAISHLSATVVELPTVAPVTRLLIDEAGMADRIQVASLDAVRTPLSGRYDSAVLSKVLQNLSAEECQMVLKHVGQALNPGGTLFIFGDVLDDSRLTPVALAAVNLFYINVFDGGQAFTESEHRTWLSEAGFELIERELLPNQLSIITARKRVDFH